MGTFTPCVQESVKARANGAEFVRPNATPLEGIEN